MNGVSLQCTSFWVWMALCKIWRERSCSSLLRGWTCQHIKMLLLVVPVVWTFLSGWRSIAFCTNKNRLPPGGVGSSSSLSVDTSYLRLVRLEEKTSQHLPDIFQLIKGSNGAGTNWQDQLRNSSDGQLVTLVAIKFSWFWFSQFSHEYLLTNIMLNSKPPAVFLQLPFLECHEKSRSETSQTLRQWIFALQIFEEICQTQALQRKGRNQ